VEKPSSEVIEMIAPSRDIQGLPITDGYSVRNVVGAELKSSLRLPRGGVHEASIVAMQKFYDGTSGGESGAYLMCWVEFRATGSRWRTAGTKIRRVEAARIAKALLSGKASKPGKNEPPRVGGKEVAVDDSTLIGASIGDAYIICVRHRLRTGDFGRTRGIEVAGGEKAMLAEVLKRLAAEKA
jgi:hypothetical protein